jgi:hypothetical protein
MRRHTNKAIVIIFLIFIIIGAYNLRNTNHKIKLQNIEIQSREAQLQELDIKYESVLQEKAKTELEKKQKIEKIKELEKQKTELQNQLQAKREIKLVEARKRLMMINTALAQQNSRENGVKSVTGCNTGNRYKDFIYMRESGCNPRAVNSIGCRGIGQACPGSKLPCGADFACQDRFFSQYAIERYGSWQRAYNFWQQNKWW